MSWKPSITPVPSSSSSCIFLWSHRPTHPTSVTLSALSLSGSGQRSQQWRPTVTWLLRKKSPTFFRPKKRAKSLSPLEAQVCSVDLRKKSRPAMSDLVKSTWWTIEWYCESCDDGHNFHPLQCYTDMKVCLHMSRSHKSYEASADIAPRRPALLGRSPWKIQSPAFAESRSKKTRASKTGCQKTF